MSQHEKRSSLLDALHVFRLSCIVFALIKEAGKNHSLLLLQKRQSFGSKDCRVYPVHTNQFFNQIQLHRRDIRNDGLSTMLLLSDFRPWLRYTVCSCYCRGLFHDSALHTKAKQRLGAQKTHPSCLLLHSSSYFLLLLIIFKQYSK